MRTIRHGTLDRMMLSNCKEEVDNLDMKYIINNLIKNVDVKLGNQRLTYGFKGPFL